MWVGHSQMTQQPQGTQATPQLLLLCYRMSSRLDPQAGNTGKWWNLCVVDSVEGLETLAQGDCGTLVPAFPSAPVP